MFSPKLNILPASQRAIWKELKDNPKYFELYGGIRPVKPSFHVKNLE